MTHRRGEALAGFRAESAGRRLPAAALWTAWPPAEALAPGPKARIRVSRRTGGTTATSAAAAWHWYWRCDRSVTRTAGPRLPVRVCRGLRGTPTMASRSPARLRRRHRASDRARTPSPMGSHSGAVTDSDELIPGRGRWLPRVCANLRYQLSRPVGTVRSL